MTTMLRIEWMDSCGHNNGRWTQAKDLEFKREHILYESVGFLLKETEYSIVIIQSMGLHPDDQDHVDAVMEIPKIAISKMAVLAEAAPAGDGPFDEAMGRF